MQTFYAFTHCLPLNFQYIQVILCNSTTQRIVFDLSMGRQPRAYLEDFKFEYAYPRIVLNATGQSGHRCQLTF